MSNKKISVIIPIYNVERYLRKCLDSVVNQTYRNLEILLINDGSPDNCGLICDEYAKRDSRIRVFHKKNAGVHAAWNDGLQKATGDWIAFVDSDDWLDLNFFQNMLEIPQANIADVIQSNGYYWECSRGQFIRWAFLEPFMAESKEERDDLKIHALIRPNDPRTKGAIGYVWGKLYRATFLSVESFQFDNQIRTGMMGDVLFNWDIFEKAFVVLGVSILGYHYRVTDDSGTYKFDPNRAKTQEYIEKQFYSRVNIPGTSIALQKAVESRCLRDIVHNLQRCYFHPDNSDSRKNVARGIREMKKMPYYKAAIYSKDNPYNGFALRVFQLALRLPWVWPLRIMVAVWIIMDKQEKTA